MTKEELTQLGEKVRRGEATKVESLEFFQEVNKLIHEFKDDLSQLTIDR